MTAPHEISPADLVADRERTERHGAAEDYDRDDQPPELMEPDPLDADPVIVEIDGRDFWEWPDGTIDPA
jgi:hypothetical protein